MIKEYSTNFPSHPTTFFPLQTPKTVMAASSIYKRGAGVPNSLLRTSAPSEKFETRSWVSCVPPNPCLVLMDEEIWATSATYSEGPNEESLYSSKRAGITKKPVMIQIQLTRRLFSVISLFSARTRQIATMRSTPRLKNDKAFVTAARPRTQPTKNEYHFGLLKALGSKHTPASVKKAAITSP